MNNRLKALATLVDANSTILDIGCDHAFLDIYLVNKDIGIKAIASDIAEGPLEQAKKNIERVGLTDQIETRLGNGLAPYTSDIDTIIISGMGGRNMIGIFKGHMKKIKNVNTIILSPNNYQEDIKVFLCKNGFYIEEEEFVKDKRFIYQLIKFKRGKKRYTKRQYFFGPIFLIKKGELFQEYYERERKSREIILQFLPKSYRLKRRKVKKEIELIEKELQK
ncbi:MAG: SAM-dependent methyltransferase [Bacilli bacterium]|nr:SAM-dependent methyltransferase [Bacilli bacterium]